VVFSLLAPDLCPELQRQQPLLLLLVEQKGVVAELIEVVN
jgi:hypothetical protein